jgi:multidrug efflux system outer membrane protein
MKASWRWRVALGAGISGTLLLLSGCLVGPNYQRPAALGTNAMPARFQGSRTNEADWKTAEPAAHLPRGAWWTVFHDPNLDRLESLATESNQELAATAARFRQARELVHVARADLFPQASFDPNYIRQRTSVNQAQLGRPAGAAYSYGTWTLPLEASWELDLWGRVRRQVEAARARLEASADDWQGVTLAIQAEVATDYFALRSALADIESLRRSVEAFQRSLELTRNRRAGGIATDLDVAQAESQLKATEAQIPAIQLEAAKLQHALATLCGRPATDFQVEAATTGWEMPSVPVSLPSELLERRPDIAAVERRMAAANADVGVAQAAFYPSVRLNGLGGLQSVSASTLFDWPSRFWAVGPTLELPLFTGGRNSAQLRQARAAYDESVAVYRQSVLVAFQEVEDQLAAGRLLTSQIEEEKAALNSAQRTLEIANNRYRAGLVTYLEVAIAQGEALNRERAVVELEGQRLSAAAGLIRALGGGWSPETYAAQR